MRKPKLAVIILIIILSFQSTPRVDAKSLWEAQVVDPHGTSSSIALDSHDNPHISYNHVPFEVDPVSTLKYAVWTGTNWTIQTVDQSAYGTVVLDSQDQPHIGYSNGSLIYASWNDPTWDMQTVDREGVGSVSLALDSNDQPHLSYLKDGSLKYAKLNNSTWTIQTVDSQGQLFDKSYIGLDKNDHPQIIYAEELDYTTYNIKYASWTGAEWRVQTAFSNASMVGNMVLDSNGRPHLIYIHSDTASGDTLTYAYWNGSAWNTQIVDSEPVTSRPYLPLLALDSLDKPHIVFYKEQEYVQNKRATVVIYAKWTGSSWEFQIALDPLSARYFMGLPVQVGSWVMDSHDRLHITTFNSIGTQRGAPRYGNLTYATLETTSVTPILLLATVAVVIAVAVVLAVLFLAYKNRRKGAKSSPRIMSPPQP